MLSNNKVKANRRNALKSTGPKTEPGKNRARRNALLHGAYATMGVILAGEGKESIADFNRLLCQLQEEWQPKGVLQEHYVRTIAGIIWKLDRVARCEKGAVRQNLDIFFSTYKAEMFRQFSLAKDNAPKTDLAKQELEESSIGIAYLLDVLTRVKTDIVVQHAVSGSARERLAFHFGQYPDFKGLSEEAAESQVIELIDKHSEYLHRVQTAVGKNEELKVEINIASRSVPVDSDLDRILRCEGHLSRQLERAIRQLQDLQAQKKRKR